MKLMDFFLEKAIINILNGDKTDGVVVGAAALITKNLDNRFGDKGSDRLKRSFAVQVILPLARELYKDDTTQFLADLAAFREDVLHDRL